MTYDKHTSTSYQWDDWEKAVEQQLKAGNTGCQTALPNGQHPGDLWYITDADNNLLGSFAWTGKQWFRA